MSRLPTVLAAILAVPLLAGCVPTGQPMTAAPQMSVEQRKMDVARLRDAGKISYEVAARRQFGIQRNAYALTEGEISFWRASIEYAMLVDRREITPEEYRRRVAEAYDVYVVKPQQVDRTPA